VQGVDWTGYDGAENMELGNGNVHFADLTTPQWFGQKFDWVMSLEVRSGGLLRRLGVVVKARHSLRVCTREHARRL